MPKALIVNYRKHSRVIGKVAYICTNEGRNPTKLVGNTKNIGEGQREKWASEKRGAYPRQASAAPEITTKSYA
jgi:hypothetical protein